MTDFRTLLSNLRRPRLLICAARCGLDDYRRDRDLKRIVVGNAPQERQVSRLFWEEEQIEQVRCSGDASYSVARHIEVLIALMAEVRLLPRRDVTA